MLKQRVVENYFDSKIYSNQEIIQRMCLYVKTKSSRELF